MWHRKQSICTPAGGAICLSSTAVLESTNGISRALGCLYNAVSLLAMWCGFDCRLKLEVESQRGEGEERKAHLQQKAKLLRVIEMGMLEM